jgi:hypothetical protein
MSSINININKTTKRVEFKAEDKVITEEMSEKITEICTLLFTDSNIFDEVQAFDSVYRYIKVYHRILYSQISNIIYAYFDEHTTEDATNTLGTMISNLDKIVAYNGTRDYLNKKAEAKDPTDKKAYEDAEKALIKIWDHVNLAQTQYSGLKQTDEEYKRKFDKSITPFKEDFVKNISSQLLTMVSIFTALAFLVFGGISSLGSIFSNHEMPLLKIIIIGCVWGLCILNLVFVFLFCVGKMTGLNFKSTQEPTANIIQKYPIVWWSDLIILTILSGSLWAYYIQKEDIDTWFKDWCSRSPRLVTWLGFGIIIIAFIILLGILVKQTWKKGE